MYARLFQAHSFDIGKFIYVRVFISTTQGISNMVENLILTFLTVENERLYIVKKHTGVCTYKMKILTQ